MSGQLEHNPLEEIHHKLKPINFVFLIYNESESISKKWVLMSAFYATVQQITQELSHPGHCFHLV